MANSNGKITAPVRLPTDVAAVLGISATDLATACTSTAINMWAKYKPVRKNLIDTITGQWDSANNKWLSSATWWKGADVSHIGGITPKQFTQFSQLISFYDGNLNGWTYDKPTGGANQPYRLQDFACYNHNAHKPIENFFMQSDIRQHGDFTASAMMSMPASDADYITLDDFSSDAFNTLYFGIAFYSGSTFKCKLTADTPGVAQIDSSFNGAAVTLQLGSYNVYPFFCNQQIPITQTQEQSGTKYYTCPNCQYVTINIVSDSTATDAACRASYYTNSNTRLQVHVTCDSGRVFTNNHWYILPMSDWNAPNTAHSVLSSGSFNFDSAGQTKDWLLQTVPAGSYFLYVTLNTAQYTLKANIIQPPSPQQRSLL